MELFAWIISASPFSSLRPAANVLNHRKAFCSTIRPRRPFSHLSLESSQDFSTFETKSCQLNFGVQSPRRDLLLYVGSLLAASSLQQQGAWAESVELENALGVVLHDFELLKKVPELVSIGKWDVARNLLADPPPSGLGSLKNEMSAVAALLGDATGDAYDTMDDVLNALQFSDTYLYMNAAALESSAKRKDYTTRLIDANEKAIAGFNQFFSYVPRDVLTSASNRLAAKS
mmetsp:Transcript_11669/g.18974  ORF Transcript_11669/g.18974 Transcript_11669/m.18974 type:complete len:231 (+) Transcript_11669:114-806(+)|eukprot:CAMPEP_0184671434 /NCGR_PEP_ID=MMETSP0308-20130426/85500_1 /TAXON_ID=38269 /ORGANISM="Gloeochaete witrockiana, Strain SAG 46.84" /LENGTH=230 /DNA_ID=CAMNT_0027118563 /DNA_START=203 /DNA_END=898 /DNA_ORIENTATION=+